MNGFIAFAEISRRWCLNRMFTVHCSDKSSMRLTRHPFFSVPFLFRLVWFWSVSLDDSHLVSLCCRRNEPLCKLERESDIIMINNKQVINKLTFKRISFLRNLLIQLTGRDCDFSWKNNRRSKQVLGIFLNFNEMNRFDSFVSFNKRLVLEKSKLNTRATTKKNAHGSSRDSPCQWIFEISYFI